MKDVQNLPDFLSSCWMECKTSLTKSYETQFHKKGSNWVENCLSHKELSRKFFDFSFNFITV